MELKVWVEGIARVICGVTESTTCQDVVIALAQSTGKTGRFTLIEKWRSSERVLSPSESPLKSLHKWGEYSSDVIFILRHSSTRKQHRSRTKWTERNLHNFTPHPSKGDQVGTPSKSLKKSLTFSGAHSSPRGPLGEKNNNSLERLDDRHSSLTERSYPKRSPYGSLEKRRHKRKEVHVGEDYQNIDRSQEGALPYSIHDGNSGASGELSSSGSGRHKKHSADLYVNSSHSQQKPKIQGAEEYDLEKHLSPNTHKVTGEFRVAKQSANSRKGDKISKDKLEDSAFALDIRGPGAETSLVLSQGIPQEKEEVAKLVKLQKEKIAIQESHMKVLETEIENISGVDTESERLVEQICEELAALTHRDSEVDNELQELDIVSWADKLQIEIHYTKTLQSEITLLRSKLAGCENEVVQQDKEIEALNEEIENERKEHIELEKSEKEEEIRVLQEVSDLQKQINERLVQHSQNQDQLDHLQTQVKEMESKILERSAHITDIEKDLKDVNLDQFNQVPSATEGAATPIKRLSPTRPGSARKLTHSPLLLKDTAVTSTNPEGLWV